MKTFIPLLFLFSLVSCSSSKNQHNLNVVYITKQMFYSQSNHNDDRKTSFLIKSKGLKQKNFDFTSFNLLYFMGEIRRKRAIADTGFSSLLENSKVLKSIEFITDSNTIYAYYWNESSSYSYKSKGFESSIKSEEIKDINPGFNTIKEKIDNGKIEETLNFLKEINFSHRSITYILSSYTFKGNKIVKTAFSIY
ncbi:hypothetical protein H2O64_21215 [Kordia sp. YSTF-M3]|uniref:Lipoprotein n=1 Tax=Kordia aestuariivivens TaxID=2759037 RepID=A0ABR7QFX9_9FLAO|nr:hypothetical protein [Kordia aestuariivivens]MBC8757204.1 hypothetical protein [Kordia aestuariivivens]